MRAADAIEYDGFEDIGLAFPLRYLQRLSAAAPTTISTSWPRFL